MANIAQFFAQHLTAPDKPLYRRYADDRWSDVSVGELAALVGRWQGALQQLRFEPGDRIAICLKNSVDWVALDLAALGLGIVVVPLYVDDNADNVAWCAANAEAKAMIVESTPGGEALTRTGTALPPLYVLHPDAGNAEPSVAALLPASAPAPRFASLPDDTLATICYTSGTSGRPKGVMLSHGNIIANVRSCRETGMARTSDTFLSILPLSHMFERTGGYYLPLSLGAKVIFCRGVALLAEDLATQAPTVMFAVPRIFEK
ncbi:MAG: AMP-binding protein, partial [Betaproteobacteria bacterium]